MNGVEAFRQIDTNALVKLAHLFQKEVSTLIDLYVSDCEKLMEKLNVYFERRDLKHINHIAREIRLNSLEIGATQFSFMMLALEIASAEHRIFNWSPTFKLISKSYNNVVDELLTHHKPHL